MKILVTGGAGFIGSHLCTRLLSEGHEVKCLDNFYNGNLNNIRGLFNQRNFQFVNGDVRDKNLLREITRDVDHVFHLAAQIHVEKSLIRSNETCDININGTMNLLELCKENKNLSMTLASSAEVYGAGIHSETSPLNPQSPYAASKVSAEALCLAYYNSYGANVRVIRNFNTFGPKQKAHGYGAVIAIFTARVLNNKPPIIYGTGEQTRDYQFIDDAVEGYMISLKVPPGQIFNTGSGKDFTISYLANKVIEVAGKDLEPIYSEPRPGEVFKLRADINKLKEYGYVPKVGIEEGLHKYIAWAKDYSFETLGYMT